MEYFSEEKQEKKTEWTQTKSNHNWPPPFCTILKGSLGTSILPDIIYVKGTSKVNRITYLEEII